MCQESTTIFLRRGLWPLVWPFVLPLSSFWDNRGASWVKAERKLRDRRQDFLHMWRAFVESNLQEQTLTCLVYCPPFMILLDDLKSRAQEHEQEHTFDALILYLYLICLWCLFPQDQYDIIERHTQSGLELVEKYVKFVKERTEIEQNYAKQLR